MIRRRGFVLVAVLVIVGAAVLAATGVVFLVRGEVAGSGNAADATRLRSAGWSAVQAVAATLGSQRQRILAGDEPSLDASITLWEFPDEVAIATILPIGPAGERIVAEGAKLAISTVTVESLVATGAVDEDLANRIIAARGDPRRLLEIDALLLAPGGAIRAEDLYGPLEDLSLALDEDERIRSGDALAALLAGGSEPRGLRDLLTVHAFDPPLSSDGTPRLLLGGVWDRDLRATVDRVLGSGSATILAGPEPEVESGAEPPPPEAASAKAAWAAWRTHYPDPDEWPRFLDRIDLAADEFAMRLDVLRASAAALKGIPGIDDERAARILREREGLTAEERSTAAWLATRGILEPERFGEVADRLTTRSLAWRVRVAARLEPDRRARRDDDDAPPRHAVYEAVIDLADAEPRIASLRELGALELVAAFALSVDAEADAEEEPEQSAPDRAPEPSVATPAAQRPSEPPSRGDATSAPRVDAAPSAPAAPARRRGGVGRWRGAGPG